MKLRRCQAVLIEPRETPEIDLAALLAGRPRLTPRRRWLALAAHLDAEIELDQAALVLLVSLSPSEWTPRDALLAQGHAAECIDSL